MRRLLTRLYTGSGTIAAPPDTNLSYRGIGTVFTSAGSTTWAIDMPDDAVQNDVLILVMARSNSSGSNLTLPTGFNHVTGSPQQTHSASGSDLVVAWRYAPSSPPSSYTATFTVSVGGAAAIFAVKDANLTDPFDGLAFNSGGVNTSGVSSSISPATSDAILFAACITAGARTFTPPGSTNEIIADQGGGPSLNMVYKQLSASGATGTLTHTISSNTNWATVMFALKD